MKEHRLSIRQPASLQSLRHSLHKPAPSETTQQLFFSTRCALLQKQRGVYPLARLLLGCDALPPPYSFPHFHTTPLPQLSFPPATMSPCPTASPGSPKTPLRVACSISRKKSPLPLPHSSSLANPAPAKTTLRVSFMNSVRVATR